MKKTDSQYVPFREAFASNRRLFLMWWRNYPGILASITVCEALGAVMPYAGIWFSARIVGELAGARRAAVLVRLVLLALGSECLLAVLRAALTRWQKSQSACVYQIMQKFEMDKMLDMDFCDADSTRVHDLRSQAFQARNWSGWGLSRLIHQWPDLIRALVQIAGGAALTASLFMLRVPEGSPLSFLNHPLCLILIGAVLLGSTLLAPVLGNRSEGYWTRYAESAKMGNRSFGFYGFMGYDSYRAGDIRLYRQDILCDLYMKKENLFGANSGIARAARGPMGLLNAASAAVSHSFTGIVYLFVCLKALGGAFGAGLVTQYVASAASFSQGLSKLISTLGGMRANAFFLRTEFELLDIPNRMYKGSLTVEKRSDRNYEIELRDVSFKYPGTQTWALRHVSLKFRVGSRLAVVGRNGSGKTTFIKLLCRLYDPDEGQILLNGIDVRKYDYREYMSIFSVVFQDFKLLAFPLGQNVAASMGFDPERVDKCLREAGFGDRLDQMESGADTLLYKDFDDRGVDISGGEAQKIAMARALYKDAPFIILDEPTAALDPVAEYEIYSRFNDIVGDKTAIYISHRLSSCRFCDEIAVFDSGRIVQMGSHDALLADKGGLYSALWAAQAQYYDTPGKA